MREKSFISGVSLFLFFCLALTGSAFGQANSDKAVIHFGASYNKALVDDTGNGFFGLDIYAGKMITNSLCLGFGVGYDIVHYDTPAEELGKDDPFKEMLSVIPFTLKAKYYFTFSQMIQAYVSAGSGVYRAAPSLAGRPIPSPPDVGAIGPIGSSVNCPGGSIGIGLDYWFLLTTGIGFEIEYHMFKVPDRDSFSYFQARVDYSLIKF
ncbi:MAG: outer membrane beta-barrel protein [Candidatus Krumholzibacteriota bacterium]|nr:outer membrane beta-barrel protein [Candidatus Krumholzibacteriota bacterium]